MAAEYDVEFPDGLRGSLVRRGDIYLLIDQDGRVIFSGANRIFFTRRLFSKLYGKIKLTKSYRGTDRTYLKMISGDYPCFIYLGTYFKDGMTYHMGLEGGYNIDKETIWRGKIMTENTERSSGFKIYFQSGWYRFSSDAFGNLIRWVRDEQGVIGRKTKTWDYFLTEEGKPSTEIQTEHLKANEKFILPSGTTYSEDQNFSVAIGFDVELIIKGMTVLDPKSQEGSLLLEDQLVSLIYNDRSKEFRSPRINIHPHRSAIIKCHSPDTKVPRRAQIPGKSVSVIFSSSVCCGIVDQILKEDFTENNPEDLKYLVNILQDDGSESVVKIFIKGGDYVLEENEGWTITCFPDREISKIVKDKYGKVKVLVGTQELMELCGDDDRDKDLFECRVGSEKVVGKMVKRLGKWKFSINGTFSDKSYKYPILAHREAVRYLYQNNPTEIRFSKEFYLFTVFIDREVGFNTKPDCV
jgi:hypothetical protein